MRILNKIQNKDMTRKQGGFTHTPTRSAGFTLIEIVVSITIMLVITSIFLADYHSTNRRRELVTAAQTMVSDIRLAQNFSLSYKKLNGVPPDYGWGVFFDKESSPNRYILFVPSALVDPLDEESIRKDDGTEDFKVVDLPDGLKIAGLHVTTSSMTGPYGGLWQQVVFVPPGPKVYMTEHDDGITMTIELRDDRSGELKEIEINFFGLVEIIN